MFKWVRRVKRKMPFGWLARRTRLGAKVDLATHIAPNIFLSIDARRDFRREKKAEKRMVADSQAERKADDDVDIDNVDDALINFFEDDILAEEQLDEGDEDVFVMEYRSLKILRKFRDKFNELVKRAQSAEEKAKFNDILRVKLSEIASVLKASLVKLEQQLAEMADRIRREKNKRHMVKDISVREWVAIYFQMRHRCSHLRRKSGKFNSVEHKVLHKLDKLLTEPDEKKAARIVAQFESDFIPAIEAVVGDAVFIEHMVTRLRIRLDDYTEREKQEMTKLLGEGFPKEEIDEINRTLVARLEGQRKNDILREYEEARAMVNLIHQSEDLALAA